MQTRLIVWQFTIPYKCMSHKLLGPPTFDFLFNFQQWRTQHLPVVVEVSVAVLDPGSEDEAVAEGGEEAVDGVEDEVARTVTRNGFPSPNWAVLSKT